jgi:hypothetical protein
MASLKDMLSPEPKDSEEPMDGADDQDDASAAEDAVKAFWEACSSGDFKAAAESLRDAVDLCGSMPDEHDEAGDMDDGSLEGTAIGGHGGHAALLLMPGGKK